MTEELERLRYPIGRFEPPYRIDRDQIERWIGEIEALPADLRRAVKGLTDSQLDTPYRPGGWTIRQVIHHLPDSHMNSFMRFKWTLTEDRPDNQALFRGPLGGTAGLLDDSGCGISRSVGRAPSTLGGTLAFPDRARSRKDVHSPRIRSGKPAGNHWFLCLARAAPPGTHPGGDPSGRVEWLIVALSAEARPALQGAPQGVHSINAGNDPVLHPCLVLCPPCRRRISRHRTCRHLVDGA